MAEATGIPALDGVRRQNDSGDVTGGGGGGRVGGDDGGEGAVDLTGEGDGCDEATATRAHGDGAGLEDPPGDAGAATADGPGGPDGDGRLAAAAAAAHSQAPESRRHRRGSAGNADAGGTGENGGGEASDAASRAVELLTQGLVSHYLPDLQRAGRSLSELTKTQMVVMDTLDQENGKLRECQAATAFSTLFTEARMYQQKLVAVRRDMLALHEKTTKLKKRALQLQQQKQKEALEREQQKEREMERERHLLARPAKRS
uniref:Biogenesis of lysosome-related organelles complex 1 subunit 6 n=1 Tax=Petromyzon marinus TaxID=7757 RepID=A0AAJ7UBY6_PETMA|nr:biogenesis of lysosome-related organelles complex 1 subunit 6 [Petromyzon marinus]XP_032832935.1 biogenesis of lysosome-related organelles complex 1 subunit 6 [Petromyzon marinus]